MSPDALGNRLDDCGVCTLLPTVTGTVRAEQATCPVHGTWPYAPRSAPSASSQALPADQDAARLLAILAAEPWLLHRPVECVNVRCGEKRWCIGCDPDGAEPCSANPWPCAIVRDKHPAFAAAYAEGEERGWHRGFDHARRYPAPTAAASSVPTDPTTAPDACPACAQPGVVAEDGTIVDHNVLGLSSPCVCRPSARWWTHGSCGPALGNEHGPRGTSCVGCGKPTSDHQWQCYPTPGIPTNGDSDG